MTEPATAPIVYIDANPFIYAVEGDDALARPLKDFFELLRQRPRVAVTSELKLPVGVAVVEPDETGLLQLMREIS